MCVYMGVEFECLLYMCVMCIHCVCVWFTHAQMQRTKERDGCPSLAFSTVILPRQSPLLN